MKKLLSKLSVDGYNPFNGFNIFLSVVSGLDFLIIYRSISIGTFKSALEDSTKTGVVLIAVVAICFLLLLFRNRKLKSIPKMIIFSALSVILGVVIIIVGIIMLVFGDALSGIEVPNGTDSKQKKQYSNSKGEYSTDGEGNFKDQYGNDVYNPQGVSDYDKL